MKNEKTLETVENYREAMEFLTQHSVTLNKFGKEYYFVDLEIFISYEPSQSETIGEGKTALEAIENARHNPKIKAT